MLLVLPGQRGPLVDLQAVLRDAHEAFRAERLAEIEKRKASGAPLDDDTRWSTLGDVVSALGGAVASHDTVRVGELAARVSRAVSGHAIVDPGEYQPNPDLEGVRVRFAVVTDSVRRDAQTRINEAWRSMARAASEADIREADEAIVDAQAALVRACLVEIAGVRVLDANGNETATLPPIADLIPAFRLAGLLAPLFVAVRHFLSLDPKKALRCGLPSSSISLSSTASPAPQRVAPPSAASTRDPSSFSVGPASPPVDVPDVT